MPQLFGQVERLELSATLWLLPLLPLVGALVNVLAKARARQRSSLTGLSNFHLAIALGTFAIALWHVTVLSGLPEGGRQLHWHGWPMARIGSVAFDFGLALDPLSAVLATVTTGIGLFLYLHLRRHLSNESLGHAFTCLHLGIASTLLFVLADGFVPMLFALPGLGICTLILARQNGSKASSSLSFLAQRVGEAGFLLGALLVLWGLGGRWLPDGMYQPDLLPRFMTVSSGDTKSEGEPSTASVTSQPASLTFTALPGAELHLNNAPFGSSPWIRRSIESGRHSIRIVTEKGQDDHEVNWFVTKPGSETAIVPLGPTLVFREIRDQLSLVDEEGRATLSDNLVGKRLFGIRLVTLACFFFLFPVIAKVAQLPLLSRRQHVTSAVTRKVALFHSALLLGASGYLLARLFFLYSRTDVTGELIAALLVLSSFAILTVSRAAGARSV